MEFYQQKTINTTGRGGNVGFTDASFLAFENFEIFVKNFPYGLVRNCSKETVLSKDANLPNKWYPY